MRDVRSGSSFSQTLRRDDSSPKKTSAGRICLWPGQPTLLEELYRDDPERADAVVFGRKGGIGRRGFLGGGAAAMGAAVGGAIPFAANMPGGMIPAALAQPAAAPAAAKGPQYLKFPGKSDKLVVLGEKPLVAETPEHLLDDDTTPIDKFFIRNNGLNTEPAKDPDKWAIKIDGEVNKPLDITLGELKSKYKAQTRRMVLECGGNGRSFFSPTARGNQWTNGGAGCAEWTGVRLSDVLKAAQPNRRRSTPRTMAPTFISPAMRSVTCCRAACGWRRRWKPTA